MNSIEFGRKISNTPMIISLVIGVLAGILVEVFTHQIYLAVILGITALVVVALFFAKSLSDMYGYWKIDAEEIKYFDYQNMSVRLQSVLLPFREETTEFKLKDIKSLTVVVGKDMNASANILGGSFNAPKKIMFHLPTPYYLDIKLRDGRQVNLDLSADYDDTETIEYVIGFICDQDDIKAQIVKQA